MHETVKFLHPLLLCKKLFPSPELFFHFSFVPFRASLASHQLARSPACAPLSSSGRGSALVLLLLARRKRPRPTLIHFTSSSISFLSPASASFSSSSSSSSPPPLYFFQCSKSAPLWPKRALEARLGPAPVSEKLRTLLPGAARSLSRPRESNFQNANPNSPLPSQHSSSSSSRGSSKQVPGQRRSPGFFSREL